MLKTLGYSIFFLTLILGCESHGLIKPKLAVGQGQFCHLKNNKVQCWGHKFHQPSKIYSHSSFDFGTRLELQSIFFAEGDNLCAHTANSISCSKSNLFEDLRSQRRIRSVSTFENRGCVIAYDGLSCSGEFLFEWRNFAFDLNSPKDVAVGEAHICVIDGSSVLCTGERATWRNLGQADPPKRYFNNPKQIVAGRFHTCVLDDDGVTCWGDNRSGKITPPELKNPNQLSAGHNHTCAQVEDDIVCWGERFGARLDVPKMSHPSKISAGSASTCAQDEKGIKCWGRSTVDEPIILPEVLPTPVQLALGDGFSCALGINQKASCWGKSILWPTKDLVKIVTGKSFACFLNKSRIECESVHGMFDYVELVPPLTSVEQVYAGENFACAKTSDTFSCWGENENRQLNVPAHLTSRFESIEHVALGGVHACGAVDNKIKCWGSYTCDARKRPCWAENQKGELNAPSNITQLQEMKAGTQHTCILADQQVQCWGSDLWGQASAPELTNPVKVLAKGHTSCAVDNTQLVCWGEYRELGDIDFEIKQPENLYLGHGHACYFEVIGADKSIKCWGTNYSGQSLAPAL